MTSHFVALPLVSADCDLRDFAFMPLDVVRLRDSDLSAISSGDEFRCAVLLWCASWHQLPASSLPDDDVILSQLAGFGRVVKEWKKVREGSLRGWVKCESDGRLYHPVIAEKANEAWNRKREQAWRTECARIKKLNQRHNADIKYPTLDDFLSPNYAPAKLLSVPDVSLGTNAPCPEGHTHSVPDVSLGTNAPCPEGHTHSVPDVSLGKQHPIDSGQGQGQGQGQGEVNLKVKSNPQAAALAQPDLREQKPDAAALADPIIGRAIEITALLAKRGAALQASNPMVRGWAEQGVTDTQALQALDIANERRQERADPSPINAGLLNAILGDIRDKPMARASPSNRRQTLTETRTETLAALTGRNRQHERTTATERDITGESCRVE